MELVSHKTYNEADGKFSERVSSALSRLPDTFILSPYNPCDDLEEAVREVAKHYKELSGMVGSFFSRKLKIILKQQFCDKMVAALETDLYICNTYIDARRKQLEKCHRTLQSLVDLNLEIQNYLDSNPDSRIIDDQKHLQNTISSYSHSCVAFDATIKTLEIGVNAVTSFVKEVIPNWNASISNSERINTKLKG